MNINSLKQEQKFKKNIFTDTNSKNDYQHLVQNFNCYLSFI